MALSWFSVNVFAQTFDDQTVLPLGVYQTEISVPVEDGNYFKARQFALKMAMCVRRASRA